MAENWNCSTTFDKSSLLKNFNFCKMAYGIYGKVHLYLYVNMALLRINMAKIKTALQFFMNISHTKFQQYLCDGLWDAWESPFMDLCK
jgi:hypothetical protein